MKIGGNCLRPAYARSYGAGIAGIRVEPDPAVQALRYGAETTVIDWHARLSCSKCGSREIDTVVTGTEAAGCR